MTQVTVDYYARLGVPRNAIKEQIYKAIKAKNRFWSGGPDLPAATSRLEVR